MASITVEFPESAKLPGELEHDPERARYLIVGALYSQHEISAAEAQQLTGDTSEAFAEKLKRYGFDVPAEAAGDTEPAQHRKAQPETRWQALAARFGREGFLDGRSEDAKRLLAESRLSF